MKNLIISLLLVCSLFTGCSSFYGNAGKTLASVEVTIDAAMKSWFIYCADHPQTEDTHNKVRKVYEKYQIAQEAALQAYVASAKVGDKSILTQSFAGVNAAKEELVQLINTFKTVKP